MGVDGGSSRSASCCRSPPPPTTTPSPARPRPGRCVTPCWRPLLVTLWMHNYSVYGRRKLSKAAHRAGIDVGRDQVARLMRAKGMRGATGRRSASPPRPTRRHRAPDLVKRNFTATRPDELWVADFTYCSTWSGIVYVAFIIDVYSRRLVGWKAARSMTADPRDRRPQHGGVDQPPHRPGRPHLPHRRREPVHLDRLHRAPQRRRRPPRSAPWATAYLPAIGRPGGSGGSQGSFPLRAA